MFRTAMLWGVGMRAAWRDVLVMGLAAVAGSLDSWSYFGLGHVFVANMTGNTVMLGFSLATKDWGHAGLSAFVIGAYVAGVFFGSMLTKPIRRVVEAAGAKEGASGGDWVPWPGRTTALLGLEWVMLVVAGMAAYLRLPGGRPADMVLLAVAGIAVGLQSAAMQAMSLPGIVTTYITGTWTTLVSGVARLGDGRTAGEGGHGSPKSWELRLWMQGGVLVVYCASAVVSGLLYRAGSGSRSGLLPAAILLLVVVGAWWGERRAAAAAG